LKFETMQDGGASLQQATLIFLAIGTPTESDGHVRLTDLLECTSHLARLLNNGGRIVVKSTVPVGTCERIQTLLETQSPEFPLPKFTVASNPEFLAEGRAI